MLRVALTRVGSSVATFERVGLDEEVLAELRRGIALFIDTEARRAECLERLSELLPAKSGRFATTPTPVKAAPLPVVEVAINDENAIVDARTRARALAIDLGFRSTEQYKIATAVSELARNIFRYAGAGKGEIRFGPVEGARAGMFIVARDDGPGIADLSAVLSESYRSKTGLGRGLQGCKKLMDEFSVETAPGKGTTVRLRKWV
jgi:serine/threonine-protein kinase RsbT